MPLPHPPGYRPRLQGRVDRRRILLAGVLFGFFAVLLASINIFGGFIVTQRMLAMFKKKQR